MRKLLSTLSSTLQGCVRGGLLLLALFASVSAIYASNTKVGGIWYDFDSSTKTASVTYEGDAPEYGSEYYGSVVIPETVTYNGITYSVTSIGGGAFAYCSSLTSVIIGESVKSIGERAFEDCSKLTSVTIPNSVTSIGDSAFRGCSSLTSVTIPNSVTSIGDSAFRGCSSLTSVTIGESVTSIGNYAFYGCSKLTSVTIPNSVTSIGEDAFEDCSSLTSVTIGKGITSIGYDAFFGCSSLTKTNYTGDIASWCNIKFYNDYANPICYSHNFYINDQEIKDLVIPNSVTSIGGSAFYGCSSLTSVTISNSVTSIGSYAFSRCSSLTKTNYTGDIAGWCNIKFGSSDANPINQSHNFYINDQEIKDLVIPNSVTSIGSYAFSRCSSLTSVTIPESVTSIESCAFSHCESLTTITIPNSVTSIGNSAFSGCSSLTSVTIGNSVTSIGYYAFSECSSLTKTNYTGDIAGWCNIIFGDNYANPMYYSHNFYINDQEIKDLVIPNSVTSIGNSAFSRCSSLTSITIPNSVTSIGDWAFSECSSLTSVTIPNSVTSIGRSVFRNCSSLTSVTIGESVTSIGESAFEGCSSLTSVTIPNSVTSIGSSVFRNCSSLTSVTCEAETPPTIGSDAFYKVSKSIPVYVPCGYVEAYKTASGWKDFTNIQEPLAEYSIEVDVNDSIMGTAKVDINSACGTQISATPNIGYHFVQWNDGNSDNPRSLVLTQDTILIAEFTQSFSGQCGDSLYWELVDTTLQITGKGEMYDYKSDSAPWKLLVSSIKVLTIAEDVTSVGEGAFSNCSALESIVWNAKNYANPANKEAAPFYDIRSQIKSFTFTEAVEYIPAYLCYGMDKLTSVTTPNSLKTIGTSAFEGCARLGKISLGTGLEEIAANAFAGCTRLYDIYTYATYPPFAEESSFANYNVYVYIPCEYQRDYTLDIVWGKFKFIECIESEDVTTDGNVTVVPGFNDVTITWPTEGNADTYTIVIKKGNEVFCTLTFNAEGQLLNIAFAPGRNGNHPAQYAEQATNGYRFTVTGLESDTKYGYNIDVKDAANKTIKSHTGEFTTQSTTAVDNITTNNANIQKIMRDGQLIIIRNGVEYNAMGQEIGN